jgi:hypothetical protein
MEEKPRPPPVHAPKKPTHEKDQGFNESHGWPPGHGGPTGPGDEPATEGAEGDAHDTSRRGGGSSERTENDAHDTGRRSRADTHPDSRE